MIWLIAVAGFSIVILKYRKKIRHFLLLAHYEAIFWLLGAVSLLEDVIYSRVNRVDELPKRSNEVAIVTGGSRGIGLEVVKKLLQCDMHVIIGCRRVEAGQEAVKKIRAEGLVSGKVDIVSLDTASLASVKKFAENVLFMCSNIHLLINNAGVMGTEYELTKDGFESQLNINYLGHCLLTHLLLPRMQITGRNSSNKPRIVNVSSCVYIFGSINFEDINFLKTTYIPNKAYAQSKLAQIMFSKALDRRLKKEGGHVSSFAVHPGVVNTELLDGTLLKLIAPWFPKLLFKNPEQGSRTIVFACLSKTLNNLGGSYLSNCQVRNVNKLTDDINQQEKLMRKTMEMLQIKL